MIAEELDELT